MRILYIHQHFALPSEGGGGRPYQFARRLAAEGHEVTMLCAGARSLDIDLEGIQVKRMKVSYENEMSIPRRLYAFADFMIRASLYSIKFKADLVFASSTPLTVSIPGLVAKTVHRVPLVFEVRDLWPKIPIEMGFLTNPLFKRIALLLERITYKNSDHIIALSPGMADGVKEVSPNSLVTVIPNASDVELFNKSKDEQDSFRETEGWDSNETVIVYAGGFGQVYSLDWVVRLAAKVKDVPIRFVMIGQGSESTKLHELALELGLDPKKLFLGKKSRADVAKYVAASDMVVSSSRLDPCLEAASLNKVFDGFAAGKPIILNHEGWLTELIQENGAGWKLDRDLDHAATQLVEITSDKENLINPALNSSKLAAAEFDRDRLYKLFSQVLKDTFNSKMA